MADLADEYEGIDDLSGRERQILDLLDSNFRSKEIGARLGIHPRTVDNHCISICRKLGVPDRFAAVRIWRAACGDAALAAEDLPEFEAPEGPEQEDTLEAVDEICCGDGVLGLSTLDFPVETCTSPPSAE